MSGRVKIKIKDKKPKIDVFKVIENRFKNMNELRDLIDMDPRKGLVRIRDGAGFREVERGGCLHRNYLNLKIEVIREGDADNGIPPSVDCSIETLEGVMKANVGDYIIKGVNGEFYPCKQDIFEKTYLHEDDMMSNISDGYHTFNELYRYRMLYNAAFFNELAKKGDIKICKSHKHYDGEECFGGLWFIVMAELPTGQISNH